MSLVDHARRELELLGTFREDPDTANGLVKTIQTFVDADLASSGGQASWTIPVLYSLLQGKSLSPLTDDPEEWNLIDETIASNCWQSRRQSDAFSEDGGKNYYLLSEGANQQNPYPKHESVHKE